MRLFIGIDIPERFKKKIHAVSEEIESTFPGKYVPGDSYHITIAYIGECDEDMHAKAIEVMAECAANHHTCKIAVGGAAYFGKPEKSILHLTADRHGYLQPVSEHLRRLLSESGLPFDPKPLVPHITLGRKVPVDDKLIRLHFDLGEFTAMGLTLFHSTRVDGELKYIPIHFEKFLSSEESI